MHHSPIYSLLHQEIKACATHLLEMGQQQSLCPQKDAQHVLSRMRELHDFATKVREAECYHALYALKHYLENTMLPYKDEENSFQSMRLSEVIAIIGTSLYAEMKFNPLIVHSLTSHFLQHFIEESKPGKSLFKNLSDIKKIYT